MKSRERDVPDVFAEALALTDPLARRVFLDAACAGKAELRREVESLLAAHADAGNFLAASDGNTNS